MNKRKYRDELLRMRKEDGKRIKVFLKQFELVFEFLVDRLEPTRPINIDPVVFDSKPI